MEEKEYLGYPAPRAKSFFHSELLLERQREHYRIALIEVAEELELYAGVELTPFKNIGKLQDKLAEIAGLIRRTAREYKR